MVEFADVPSAEKAKSNLDGQEVNGQTIAIKFGVDTDMRRAQGGGRGQPPDSRGPQRGNPGRRFDRGEPRAPPAARGRDNRPGRLVEFEALPYDRLGFHMYIRGLRAKADWRALKDELRRLGDVKYTEQLEDFTLVAEFRTREETSRVADALNRGAPVFNERVSAEIIDTPEGIERMRDLVRDSDRGRGPPPPRRGRGSFDGPRGPPSGSRSRSPRGMPMRRSPPRRSPPRRSPLPRPSPPRARSRSRSPPARARMQAPVPPRSRSRSRSPRRHRGRSPAPYPPAEAIGYPQRPPPAE